MAITSAALQTALGTNATVIRHEEKTVGSIQEQYVLGNAGTVYAGRARWVQTTESDNAATQATAVLAALVA